MLANDLVGKNLILRVRAIFIALLTSFFSISGLHDHKTRWNPDFVSNGRNEAGKRLSSVSDTPDELSKCFPTGKQESFGDAICLECANLIKKEIKRHVEQNPGMKCELGGECLLMSRARQ